MGDGRSEGEEEETGCIEKARRLSVTEGEDYAKPLPRLSVSFRDASECCFERGC